MKWKNTISYLHANSITYKIIYFFSHFLERISTSSGIYLTVEGNKKLLSHLYNGKKGEKRFMENQQLVKYFDFFSFFEDEKSCSWIFTLCNQKIIFKWKVKLCKKDSLKNNNLSKILKEMKLRWYFVTHSWIFTLCQANKKNWKKWVRFFDFFTCSVCKAITERI